MNQGAVDRLIAHGVKLGADVGVAAGRLGAWVGAATTTHFGEDIYVFAKSKGLFGGFWLDGTYVRAKHDWNAGLLRPPGRSAARSCASRPWWRAPRSTRCTSR